jgi:hypothetical protein
MALAGENIAVRAVRTAVPMPLQNATALMKFLAEL